MSVLTDTQKNLLYDQLSRDQVGNHQLLTYYLKKIRNNQSISVAFIDKSTIDLTAQEAWDIITQWVSETGISLPIGEKGSRLHRVSSLINYLELTIQESPRDSSVIIQPIIDSTVSDPLKNAQPQTREGRTLKKMIELRNLQFEAVRRQSLGLLQNEIQKTAFLQRFAKDPYTFSVLSGLLAANATNLLTQPDSLNLAEEVAKTTQSMSGYKAINNAAHLAYSEVGQRELIELQQVINQAYEKVENKQYAAQLEYLPSLTHILTLSDIPTLIDLLAPDASPNDRALLSRALETAIISTTNQGYVDGETILSRAFSIAKFPPTQTQSIVAIAPFIEEIRGTELRIIRSGGLRENDPHLQSTLKLSQDLGVAPEISWLSIEDLQRQAIGLMKKYNTKDLSVAIEKELARGSGADFKTISELKLHHNNQIQHTRYLTGTRGDFISFFRDKIGHGKGRVADRIAPLSRFYQKIDKRAMKVYGFINAPTYYLADQLELIQEKLPLTQLFLNPGKVFASAQLWIAKRIGEWSEALASKGSWYSGIFSQVSDFTKGFIHHEGSWDGASFHFIQKKWGNILEWGSKKAGYEGWQAVKAKIGTSLWNGFAKIAPGLANKIQASSLSKLAASFMLGELTAGTTLAIQIGAMIVWEGIKGVWNFLFNPEKREEMLNNLPIAMWIGSAIGGIIALPSMIVGGLIALGSTILGGIGALTTSLLAILLPAMIVAGIALFSIHLFTNMVQLSSRLDVNLSLDSGAGQFIGNILCEGGDSGGNQKAKTAACIIEILSKCGINPLTASNANGSSWQCVLASTLAQSAIAELQRSATNYSVLQCVGFIVAVDVATGGAGTGFGNANSLGTSPPSGYRYAAGVGSCSPGDFFVDTSGAWGHTGVFLGVSGPTIKCMDANGGGPGVVRGSESCTWLTSKVAGCLKKN